MNDHLLFLRVTALSSPLLLAARMNAFFRRYAAWARYFFSRAKKRSAVAARFHPLRNEGGRAFGAGDVLCCHEFEFSKVRWSYSYRRLAPRSRSERCPTLKSVPPAASGGFGGFLLAPQKEPKTLALRLRRPSLRSGNLRVSRSAGKLGDFTVAREKAGSRFRIFTSS